MLRSPLGGLFRHVRDLVRGQSAQGLELGIVCDSQTGGAFAEHVLETLRPECRLGVVRTSIPRNPGWSDVAIMTQLRRICAERQPDIVHGHGAKGGAYARLLAHGVGARAVCTPHGGSLHYTFTSVGGALYLMLERLLKYRTDGMIFESDYARRTYVEKIGGLSFPSRVIHNGLYDSEFATLPGDAQRYDFAFIGEIRELKGIYVLLDAIAIARRQHDFSVLMAGSGPDEARLRDRIEALGLGGTITLSPPIYPVTEAFQQAACIVAPSLAESLPYLVLETLAAGKPMLTTRVGGIPEIFGPHAAGLLVPGDSAGLARAILTVLDDPSAAQRHAEQVREHIRAHLRVTDMVNATIEFYHELAGLAPARIAAAGGAR